MAITPPKRPNVLLIWTDEQRRDTFAPYGNDFVQAPHLNSLAERSFVFEQAYCCQPVCTPSRGCILTGTWPHEHGAMGNNQPLNADARTLAEMVDDSYQTAYYGKWHLGDEITAQHGWDKWVSIEDNYRAFYSDPADRERFSDYHHFLWDSGFPCSFQSDGKGLYGRSYAAVMAPQFTKAQFLGREAATYIRSQQDSDEPWLLSVNFLEPHMPFFGPYNDRYRPEYVPVGPAFNVPPAENHSKRNHKIHAKYRENGMGGRPLKTEADWRRMRANYLGLVSLVDDAVGMMLHALHDAGLAEDTIVVFTSDHGEMMGDHVQIGKTVLYEESLGIPWTIHVPWLSQKQEKIAGPISQIDLAPTLLDLMGQEVPSHLQGVSRKPVLEGETTLEGNDAFAIWNSGATVNPKAAKEKPEMDRDDWRTVASGEGFKLNLCASDQCELFDLNEDPHELVNLYDDPGQKGRIADLTERIVAWQKQVGDPVAVV